MIRLNGELREIHVDWRDDAFVEVAGPLTDTRLAAWFVDAAIELAENQRAEVNLAMLDWVADADPDDRAWLRPGDRLRRRRARICIAPEPRDGHDRAFSGRARIGRRAQ